MDVVIVGDIVRALIPKDARTSIYGLFRIENVIPLAEGDETAVKLEGVSGGFVYSNFKLKRMKEDAQVASHNET